jgi:hypothetical protein
MGNTFYLLIFFFLFNKTILNNLYVEMNNI